MAYDAFPLPGRAIVEKKLSPLEVRIVANALEQQRGLSLRVFWANTVTKQLDGVRIGDITTVSADNQWKLGFVRKFIPDMLRGEFSAEVEHSLGKEGRKMVSTEEILRNRLVMEKAEEKAWREYTQAETRMSEMIAAEARVKALKARQSRSPVYLAKDLKRKAHMRAPRVMTGSDGWRRVRRNSYRHH